MLSEVLYHYIAELYSVVSVALATARGRTLQPSYLVQPNPTQDLDLTAGNAF